MCLRALKSAMHSLTGELLHAEPSHQDLVQSLAVMARLFAPLMCRDTASSKVEQLCNANHAASKLTAVRQHKLITIPFRFASREWP